MELRKLAFVAMTCLTAGACGSSTGGYDSPTSTPTSPSGTSSGTPPAADLVTASASLAFTPAVLTTNVGHTVTFTFESVGHNVFFDAATGVPADIPGVNANTSITRTFNTAGTYTYTCHIHPYMQGTVVVKP